ncbi:hypothetical protein [Methylobacillus glycogenes]|uniref:hypothetical protein n=1 Tax=Methylobacillus glycogenes TaxID=406 RepID=UPI0011DCB750|nr:hypothetical protein [Methylobacillus glycogenes]
MNDDKQALLTIKNILSEIVSTIPTLQEAKGAGRIFELYVLMKLARALKTLKWDIEVLSPNGTLTGTFIQRAGAPSGFTPTDINGPTSLKIVKGAAEYEIWNGIQFEGRSKTRHEIDISVIPHAMAQAMRKKHIDSFPFGRPRVCVECKDVMSTGSLDEMRAFVARLYDLTILNIHSSKLYPPLSFYGHIYDSNPPTYAHPPSPITFRDSNRDSFSAIARSTGFSKGTDPLSTYYNIHRFENIVEPSTSADKFIENLAKWIDQKLH